MKREELKMLIELSATVEEADAVITNEGFSSVKEKFAFLRGMFDFKLIGRFNHSSVVDEESEIMDYYAVLSAIINSKWEA